MSTSETSSPATAADPLDWGPYALIKPVFDECMRLAAEAGALAIDTGKPGGAPALLAARALLEEAGRLALIRIEGGASSAPAPSQVDATSSAVPPALSKDEWLAAFAPER